MTRLPRVSLEIRKSFIGVCLLVITQSGVFAGQTNDTKLRSSEVVEPIFARTDKPESINQTNFQSSCPGRTGNVTDPPSSKSLNDTKPVSKRTRRRRATTAKPGDFKDTTLENSDPANVTGTSFQTPFPEEVRNVTEKKPVKRKTRRKRVSTVKPTDLKYTILRNPDISKEKNVNSSAVFGIFNDTESGKKSVPGNDNATISESEKIYKSLRRHRIIPDVLYNNTATTLQHLQVSYGTNVIKYGTEVYSLQIENEPFVGFKGEKNSYYALIAVGPDMPSYAEHDERNWLHWCVGNIPGGNVSRGRVITPYCGLTLGYELGPHRIVFLLYKQPLKNKIMKFKESDFSDKLDFFRRGFYNPYIFVERYNLTGPIAANFLIGLWENEIHQAGSIYQ